jgi:hypothetical protein
LWALVVAAIAVGMLAPVAAYATSAWSAAGAGPGKGKTKAILPPTFGAATAITSTSVTLNWSAPGAGGATLTGYALTQSPGTLAGCSATPTAAAVSCTATGLTAGTTYTWTLKSKSGNWQSAGAVDIETSRSQPTITTPNSSTTATFSHSNNGATFTITGSNFAVGATVTSSAFDITKSGNGVTVASATQINMNVNAHGAGTYSLVVTNPDGGSVTSSNSVVVT